MRILLKEVREGGECLPPGHIREGGFVTPPSAGTPCNAPFPVFVSLDRSTRVLYITFRLINQLVKYMNQALDHPRQISSHDPLSTVFLALSDPTRRAMLKALAQGDHTLTELARPFSISIPAVTKHLRILERAGLISRSRQAQRKPCSLRVEPLKDAAEWIDQYRAEWEARLDRLDAFVVGLQQQEDALQEGPPPDPSNPSTSSTDPDQGEQS